MATYFVRTALPVNPAVEAHYEALHRAGTGNNLSVLRNGMQTECLLKVTCGIITHPEGFTPTEVIEGVEAARTLINSPTWQATE